MIESRPLIGGRVKAWRYSLRFVTRNHRGWGIAVLVLFVTLPINYVLLLGAPEVRRLLGGFDSAHFFCPLTYLLDHSLGQGEWPLWNPLTYCGLPLGANPQSLVFYPPHIVRGLLCAGLGPLSSILSLRIEAVLHVALAFLGMFGLARVRQLSVAASLLAACTFAYGVAMITSSYGAWVLLASAAWLPLSLLLLTQALKASNRSESLAYALLAGLTMGMTFLGGATQIFVYHGLILGVFALLHGPFPAAQARRDAAKRGLLTAIRGVGLVAVVTAVALLAGAVLLLPAAEFAGLSTRGSGAEAAVDYQVPCGWVLWPYHVRVGVLLLCMVALASPRKAEALIWGGLALVLLDCLYGPPAPIDTLLRLVCPFQLSSPNRAGRLLPLPLGMLAGLGLDHLRHLAQSSPRARYGRAAFAAGAGLALVLIYRVTQPLPGPPWPYWASLLGAVAVAGGLLAGRFRWAPWGVLGLLAVEILSWSSASVRDSLKSNTVRRSVAEVVRPRGHSAANQRVLEPEPNLNLFDLAPAINGCDPVSLQRSMHVLAPLAPPGAYHRMLFPADVAARNPRGHLLLKRRFWLTRQYVNGPLPSMDTLFPVTTTAYLSAVSNLGVPEVAPASLTGTGVSERATEKSLDPPLVEREGDGQYRFALPLVPQSARHSVLTIRYRSTAEAKMSIMLHDLSTGRHVPARECRLNPTEADEALIPLPDSGPFALHATVRSQVADIGFEVTGAVLREDLNDEDDLLSIRSARANEVSVDVGPLPGPRLLVFTDAAYPGWRVEVDGRVEPLHVADDAFKAVVVPPGRHTVTFSFRPRRVYVGLAVSVFTAALTTLAAAALLVAGRRHRLNPTS